MNTTEPATRELPDDPRLMEAVQEYLDRLEAGQPPNRQEILRRYPDLAGPIAECLDGLDLVHRAAGSGQQAAGSRVVLPSTAGGTPSADALPANPLGDFQIVREIGRGGMGVVYEAVQLSLGRRVAVKVLPFAATFDPKHLQRFHNEATAAAQLHHTNIVPVYAVGCERGVHFYAMQLIEGESLATVVDRLCEQRAAGSGQQAVGSGRKAVGSGTGSEDQTVAQQIRPLSVDVPVAADETVSQLSLALSTQRSNRDVEYFRGMARFMVQAADALDHAHQFGIVHRDIKPANLLIDEHRRLWVTDFGLAQFHADGGLTQTGDILGTLRYMSPEQATGQRVLIDHRTDIYSLGATLYELVTLEPICPGQSRQELLHQIIQEEPRAPRSLEKTVPIELETIILKAVSKNPIDRYRSAKEFGADLQRYLDDQPILAKRPSLVERARKWARRHPSFVGAAVLLLVFGVIGFGVSTAFIARAYDGEKKRALEAEQRFELAKRSADEMIRIANEELAENPAMQKVRRRLLETALSFYQEFIELRGANTRDQKELADVRDRITQILSDLALLQGAGQHLLLKSKSVLDDLKLSEEQRERLDALLMQMDQERHETFRDFFKLDAAERQKRFLDLARVNEVRVAATLEPVQLGRLRQIALQLQGPMAFSDPDIATALKLTAEQKKQIRGIEASMFFDKPPPPPGGPGPKGPWKGFEEKRVATMHQIIKVLTPEQARQWRLLTGEPFVGGGPMFMPMGPPPFGGFGPPPPPPPDGQFEPFRPKKN